MIKERNKFEMLWMLGVSYYFRVLDNIKIINKGDIGWMFKIRKYE